MTDSPDHAREIKFALTNVREVCERLELLHGPGSFMRQSTGLMIRCPQHGGLSCSVTKAPDGTIRVRCFGCDFRGDVLTLIAAARGLTIRRDFREILREGAQLAGLWGIVEELDTGRRVPDRPRVEPLRAEPEPPRDYPAQADVDALWSACVPVSEDDEVASWLRGRAIDPDAVDGRDLARALPRDPAPLPRFARYRGRSWDETGHRLIVPMRDAAGAIRSVRAGRVRDGESPKRLPPAGHRASELVMADDWGATMLRGDRLPDRILVVEGEPDYLTWASRLDDPSTATIGIVSGSWCEAIAARFPRGAKVLIRTDLDRAGDAYAVTVARSLRGHCFLRRWSPESAP